MQLYLSFVNMEIRSAISFSLVHFLGGFVIFIFVSTTDYVPNFLNVPTITDNGNKADNNNQKCMQAGGLIITFTNYDTDTVAFHGTLRGGSIIIHFIHFAYYLLIGCCMYWEKVDIFFYGMKSSGTLKSSDFIILFLLLWMMVFRS